MQEPLRSLLQSQLGNQSDNLAGDRNHAVALCLAFHEFKGAVHGSLLEVGQVHGNLGHAAHQESRGFDVAQAAGGKAYGLGDLFGYGDVRGVQKDVVGHEKLARAHHGGSGRGMHAWLTEVRLARRVGCNVVTNSLELAATNVLQILPFGRRRRGFVEIDRDLEALPDFGAHVAGHGNAIFNCHAVDGDEGNYISRAHARVRASVLGEVDQLGGLAHAAQDGFLNGFPLAHQRNDAAIVVGIHLTVEEIDAGNFHGLDNGIDLGRVAAFRKIGNTFDKSAGHAKKDNDPRLDSATGR